jgi:hypothetical protein
VIHHEDGKATKVLPCDVRARNDAARFARAARKLLLVEEGEARPP